MWMSLSLRPARALRYGAALVALSTAMTGLVPATPALAAPARADLAIDVTATPTRIPTTGNVSSVDVGLTNKGSAVANAPAVTITLPSGAYVAGEGPGSDAGWLCDLSTKPRFRCTHAALAAGQNAARLLLPIRLPAGDDGDVVAVAAVASSSSTDVSTRNNAGKATITYDAAISDIYIANGIQPTSPYVVSGDWVKYGIDVGNSGSGVAKGVTVRVTTPNLTDEMVSDWSDPSWECIRLSSPGEWECTHAPVAPGATTGILLFSGAVPDAAPGTVLPYTFTVATTTPYDYPGNNAHEGAFEYSGAVLRGQFWEDTDHDGQRGAEDPSVAVDAYLRLVSVYGGEPRDVPLNTDGSFNMLAPPDFYYLEVTLNDVMYSFTYPNVGDDATDSDVGSIYPGQSDQFFLNNGSETVIDFGLVKITS
jgi:hypothetical protein